MRPLNLIPIVVLMLFTQSALAVRVVDITRLGGERTVTLTGTALVVGLKGTGDGPASLPAVKSLLEELAKSDLPCDGIDICNSANIAIVHIYATLPISGARSGDKLDVGVSCTGKATSLRGGMLFFACLLGPDGRKYQVRGLDGNLIRSTAYAIAVGPIELPDLTNPTSGIVKAGAVMEVDVPVKYIDSSSRFTLITDPELATWTTASGIAKLINESDDSGEQVAVVVDPRTIIVQIPTAERSLPDSFISGVLQLVVPANCIQKPRPVVLASNSKVNTFTSNATAEAPRVAASAAATPVPFLANPKNKYWNLGLWWVGGCLLMNTFTRLFANRKPAANLSK